MNGTLSFILGGGRGAGLYPLTSMRSVPAVSVAGKYRVIDIPLSNCINSGIRRIYVLTQFLSVSLHRHIANTYGFAPFSQGHVQVLAAQQTNDTADWYQGTADALRQNLRYLSSDRGRDVLILSGDGLYRMDYADLVKRHRQSAADLTIAAVRVPADRASSYGLLRTGNNDTVLELVEKPRDPAVLAGLRLPEGDYLANMGVYVCQREFLLSLLRKPANDLVTGLFMPALATHRVRAHLFDGYWHDLGSSIAAYHRVHLDLAGSKPPFDFNAPHGTIYTHMRNLPASRIEAAELTDTIVSDGCFVSPGCVAISSVIGQRLRVGANVQLREAVLCGADRYETVAAQLANREAGIPDIGVGPGSVLHRMIADKDCRIGAGVRIVNEKNLTHHDGNGYCIRDGIVVVPRGAIIPDGTVI